MASDPQKIESLLTAKEQDNYHNAKATSNAKFKKIVICLVIIILVLIAGFVATLVVLLPLTSNNGSTDAQSSVNVTSSYPTYSPSIYIPIEPSYSPTDMSSTTSQQPTTFSPTAPTEPSAPTTVKPTSVQPTTQPTTSEPSKTPTTAQPTKLPTSQPTSEPTRSPSKLPTTAKPTTAAPTFSGQNSFSHGYNVWTDQLAGSMIVDVSNPNNIQQWNSDTQSCSYNSMVFDKSYDSYSSYSQGWSADISEEFNIADEDEAVKVKGSASATSSTMKTASISAELYYYTMNIKCIVSQSSLVSYSKVYWTDDFILDLGRLPTIFSPEDVYVSNDFRSFFQTYGTHVIKSADFGGKIKAALSAYVCKVLSTFSSSTGFKTCLNLDFIGVSTGSGSACASYSSETDTSTAISTSTSTSEFSVVGGSIDTMAQILNDWENNNSSSRASAFGQWLLTLSSNPTVVSGNLDAIYDVIRWCVISPTGHNLNIPDDILLNISSAMKLAYQYNEDLLQSSISNIECDFECADGELNTTSCKCENCRSNLCCNAVIGINDYHRLPILFMSILVCVLL